MIKPRHLEKIYVPTNAAGTEGEIVCTCGCKAFGVRYFGEFYDANKLACAEHEDGFGQAVRAICADCKKDYLLYDFALHGYDGLICEAGAAVPEEALQEFKTNADDLFEIEMVLEYDGEDQFQEEILNDGELIEKFHLTMADRASIWTWVVIRLKGVRSGTVYPEFVDEELA